LAFHSGREADHSPPSSAEVKELVELYFHGHNTPSWRGAQLGGAQGQLFYLYLYICGSSGIRNHDIPVFVVQDHMRLRPCGVLHNKICVNTSSGHMQEVSGSNTSQQTVCSQLIVPWLYVVLRSKYRHKTSYVVCTI
jgi:hypothetical protein